MKITKMLCNLPIDYICWMGVPFKHRRHSYSSYSPLDHYGLRLMSFIGVFGLCVLVVLTAVYLTMVLIGLIAFVVSFDLIIMGCRAVLVSRIMNEVEEGGQQITIYNQADLWKDDKWGHGAKPTYNRFYDK